MAYGLTVILMCYGSDKWKSIRKDYDKKKKKLDSALWSYSRSKTVFL